MNKKILISLSVIGAVAAIAIGGTIAYFSDTETSTGNTFTAGAIDLTIDSQCKYNGQTSDQCGSWTLKDLNPTSDKFFNFGDVKPGDQGENTISLHVISNDAYACLYISPLVNNDNSCTEPESAEDASCGATYDPNGGELAQNVQFFAWDDVDGDNIWEDGEMPLFSNIKGPASDVLNGKTYPLGTIAGGATKYLGVQWCMGNMTVDTNNYTITCDGSAMGNDTQSDSIVGSIAFYVEQQRNNPNFVCPASPFLQ